MQPVFVLAARDHAPGGALLAAHALSGLAALDWKGTVVRCATDHAVRLVVWRKLKERSDFSSFSDLKRAFNSVDRVGDYFVFNIAGNRYRLIAAIHFSTQARRWRRSLQRDFTCLPSYFSDLMLGATANDDGR